MSGEQHVANILLAGSCENASITLLKRQNDVLNEERLKEKPQCSYIELDSLLDKHRVRFIKVDASSSENVNWNQPALVYFFDLKLDLDSQINKANRIFKQYKQVVPAGQIFLVAQTKNIVPTQAEQVNIQRIQKQKIVSHILLSKRQQDMSTLRKNLLKLTKKVVVGESIYMRLRSESSISQHTEIEATSNEIISLPRTPSPDTITVNLESDSLLVQNTDINNAVLSIVEENNSQSTDNFRQEEQILENSSTMLTNPVDIESWIANFRKKYDVDNNKNSTGIHDMLSQMETIKQGVGTVEGKQQKISAIMTKIANERLHGWGGLRSFWSNSSFFGKGRSTDAKALYEACSQNVTWDRLSALV